MSAASAGKVLMLPKGEYDATTQYKVLDWVLYQGRPYVAKQTTTGNAPIYEPTQANPDNYWQLLLDFPTVVDNVPTENSNNLVKSGGVYLVTADKMEVTGANADKLQLGGEGYATLTDSATITKAAGANENVSVAFTVSTTNNKLANILAYLGLCVGATLRYYDNPNYIYLILDSVSNVDTAITLTCHLVEDDTAAISLSNQGVLIANYSNNDRNIINGWGQMALGTPPRVVNGEKNAISTDRPALISGLENVISSRGSGVIGNYNYNHGAFSTIIGNDCESAYRDQVIVGVGNNNKSDTRFEVGGGSHSSPKNVFEVYHDGFISMDDGTTQFKFSKSSNIFGYYDINNDFHKFWEPLILTNSSVVLSTSQDTTVTFNNAAITDDSIIEVLTDNYTIAPKNVVVASGGGSVTVTFAKVSSSTTIKVRVLVTNV